MSERKADIDKERIIKYWIESSDEDYETMITLYKSKSYGWALFLGHISTEKLLKTLYVKQFNEHAPFTHNLYRLSELIGLNLSDEYSDWFD